MAGKFIYATAANGMTVRIPEEQFEAWQKTQDEIRAGTYQETEEDRLERAEMLREIKARIARYKAQQGKSPDFKTYN